MSEKPKLRWYQFSLKTLLIGMVLVSLPVGRVGYLLERARHHEHEAQKIVRLFASEEKGTPVWDDATYLPFGGHDDPIDPQLPHLAVTNGHETRVFYAYDEAAWQRGLYHRNLALAYRQAIRSPWFPVTLPPAP